MNEKLKHSFELVDTQDPRILEHFRAVIAVDTSVPPGRNYETLDDVLEPQFQRPGFTTERVVITGDFLSSIPLPLEGPPANLVATRSTCKEPVSIYALMNVVPKKEGWQHDHSGADYEDRMMFGRGTTRIQGAIASILTAFEVMDAAGIEPGFDLHVVHCTDEEIRGNPGIWHLAKKGHVQGHMLCLEGFQETRIGLASAGAVDVTITTRGKSDHSCLNLLSVNAIDAMLPIMNELAVLTLT